MYYFTNINDNIMNHKVSGRRNARPGKCPVGEVSGRGCVHRGSVRIPKAMWKTQRTAKSQNIFSFSQVVVTPLAFPYHKNRVFFILGK